MALKKVQVTQFLHQRAISMTSYPVHVDSALLITLYSVLERMFWGAGR